MRVELDSLRLSKSSVDDIMRSADTISKDN